MCAQLYANDCAVAAPFPLFAWRRAFVSVLLSLVLERNRFDFADDLLICFLQNCGKFFFVRGSQTPPGSSASLVWLLLTEDN